MGLIGRGIGPLAETQSGALAGVIGAPWAIGMAAAIVAAAAAVTTRTNKALWTFSFTDSNTAARLPPI